MIRAGGGRSAAFKAAFMVLRQLSPRILNQLRCGKRTCEDRRHVCAAAVLRRIPGRIYHVAFIIYSNAKIPGDILQNGDQIGASGAGGIGPDIPDPV